MMGRRERVDTKVSDFDGRRLYCDRCGHAASALVRVTWTRRRQEERDDGRGVDLHREKHEGDICVERCLARFMGQAIEDQVRDVVDRIPKLWE